MNELEAVGDAVTGGVLGRAVEPKAGEPGADGHTHERNCLNCGTLLAGDYCHACGQQAHVHRTLTRLLPRLSARRAAFRREDLENAAAAPWKPGELTRRYIDGERARFVSPIALFLFSVFLMFAAVTLFGGMGELPAQAKQGLQEELRIDQQKLAELEAQRVAAEKAGQPAAKINEQIGDLKDEIKAIEGVPQRQPREHRRSNDKNSRLDRQ